MAFMTLRRWKAALVVVLAVAAAGCRSMSINDVIADPGKYRGQTITVHGTMAEGGAILGRGAYRIVDGDRGLWVVTSGGVPSKGARVDVTGRLQDGYDLSGLGRILKLPEALQNGLVLIESSHEARD